MGYIEEFKYCPKCKIEKILRWRERDQEHRCEKCNKITVVKRWGDNENELVRNWEYINGEKL